MSCLFITRNIHKNPCKVKIIFHAETLPVGRQVRNFAGSAGKRSCSEVMVKFIKWLSIRLS